MSNEVRVGVGVIILRDHRILLGERIGSHGSNTWATPGGHLEIGESVEDCARREVFEETGLALTSFKKLGYTNDIFNREGKHYVTLYVVAVSEQGEAQRMEPTKCKQWRWCELDALPQPLFLPLINFLNDGGDLHAIARQYGTKPSAFREVSSI